MSKRWFFLSILILIPLVLAACAPPQTATPVDTAKPPAEEAPSAPAAPASSEEPAAPAETPTAAPARPTPTLITGPQMECTLVSNQQQSTPQLEAILGVKENDWVYGPETAAVTIVEYSDFQ